MPALIRELLSDDSQLGDGDEEPCNDCLLGTRFPVHRAAALGHVGCLLRILASRASPDVLLDEQQNTPLHTAANAGQSQTLKVLLDETRIPVRARNRAGLTCAHLAARRGCLDGLKILFAGRLPKAQLLASERDSKGSTVLHHAVLANDNDSAIWLLQRFGKDIANICSLDDVLPLHIAAAHGNIEFIRTATKYDLFMANRRDRNGATPAFYAVQGGHLQCLQYLVDKAKADQYTTTRKGQSLLHAACLNGHTLIVQWLLGRMVKSSIFQQTREGATVFHCAAYGGHVGILRLLHQKVSSAKKYMGSSTDAGGNTPLHLAAMRGHQQTVRFLLDHGADPKAKNRYGLGSIELAERANHHHIVAMLIAHHKGRGFGFSKYKRKAASMYIMPASELRRTKSLLSSTNGHNNSSPSLNSEGYAKTTMQMPDGYLVTVESVNHNSNNISSSGYGSSNENLNNKRHSSAFDHSKPTSRQNPIMSFLRPDRRSVDEESLLADRENWLLKRQSVSFPPNTPEEPKIDYNLLAPGFAPLLPSKSAPDINSSTNNVVTRRTPEPHIVDEKQSPTPIQIHAAETAVHTRSRVIDDVIIRRRFIDAASQTDPDALVHDVIIVDDTERILYASNTDIPRVYARLQRHRSLQSPPLSDKQPLNQSGVLANLQRKQRKKRTERSKTMPSNNNADNTSDDELLLNRRPLVNTPSDSTTTYASVHSNTAVGAAAGEKQLQQNKSNKFGSIKKLPVKAYFVPLPGLHNQQLLRHLQLVNGTPATTAATKAAVVVDSDREVKYAGIAAAEQIDQILRQDEEEYQDADNESDEQSGVDERKQLHSNSCNVTVHAGHTPAPSTAMLTNAAMVLNHHRQSSPSRIVVVDDGATKKHRSATPLRIGSSPITVSHPQQQRSSRQTVQLPVVYEQLQQKHNLKQLSPTAADDSQSITESDDELRRIWLSSIGSDSNRANQGVAAAGSSSKSSNKILLIKSPATAVAGLLQQKSTTPREKLQSSGIAFPICGNKVSELRKKLELRLGMEINKAAQHNSRETCNFNAAIDSRRPTPIRFLAHQYYNHYSNKNDSNNLLRAKSHGVPKWTYLISNGEDTVTMAKKQTTRKLENDGYIIYENREEYLID